MNYFLYFNSDTNSDLFSPGDLLTQGTLHHCTTTRDQIIELNLIFGLYSIEREDNSIPPSQWELTHTDTTRPHSPAGLVI